MYTSQTSDCHVMIYFNSVFFVAIQVDKNLEGNVVINVSFSLTTCSWVSFLVALADLMFAD
jgi:hypothetical protein